MNLIILILLPGHIVVVLVEQALNIRLVLPLLSPQLLLLLTMLEDQCLELLPQLVELLLKLGFATVAGFGFTALLLFGVCLCSLDQVRTELLNVLEVVVKFSNLIIPNLDLERVRIVKDIH